MRCSRVIVYFPCLSPGISLFSNDPQFLLVENRIQMRYLAPGLAWLLMCHCLWATSAEMLGGGIHVCLDLLLSYRWHHTVMYRGDYHWTPSPLSLLTGLLLPSER